MLDIRLDFSKKDLAKIYKMPEEFKAGTLKGVRKSMFHAERMSKQDFEKSRSGAGGLHARTGNLRRLITSGVYVKGTSVVGWLGNNSVYARIHELGGVIRPRTKQYLRFQIDGFWKTVKSVVIPQRPFIEPGITENIEEIKDIIRNSIVTEVNK